MGIYGTGLVRMLEVAGALTRGFRADRLELPRDGQRQRWNRDELGLFQWTAAPRRFPTKDSGHAIRASVRSPA